MTKRRRGKNLREKAGMAGEASTSERIKNPRRRVQGPTGRPNTNQLPWV
jgi:hypothetical protein